jgi:hypothetical protein
MSRRLQTCCGHFSRTTSWRNMSAPLQRFDCPCGHCGHLQTFLPANSLKCLAPSASAPCLRKLTRNPCFQPQASGHFDYNLGPNVRTKCPQVATRCHGSEACPEKRRNVPRARLRWHPRSHCALLIGWPTRLPTAWSLAVVAPRDSSRFIENRGAGRKSQAWARGTAGPIRTELRNSNFGTDTWHDLEFR